jgi:branched-subunit amino acid aminotransferase/4-amino-4-deoxychorismate lyase
MTASLAYLNGRLLPESDARLSMNDAGFVMGATVTDNCRTFRHRLYRWPNHLARFRRSCQAVGLNLPGDDESLSRTAEDLVAHNATLLSPEHDLALVVFATPGLIASRVATSEHTGPTLGMHTYTLPFAQYRPWFTQGFVLITPSIRQVPAACVDPRIKQRSRIHWWLAQQELRRIDPDAHALLCDANGHLCETALANFLIVCQGTVLSPPLDAVLEGVSLGVVEELCRDLCIPFARRLITLDDAASAEEAMLCSTGFCLAGVRRLNQVELPWPGPIFVQLLSAWSRQVGIAIDQQILTAP